MYHTLFKIGEINGERLLKLDHDSLIKIGITNEICTKTNYILYSNTHK